MYLRGIQYDTDIYILDTGTGEKIEYMSIFGGPFLQELGVRI